MSVAGRKDILIQCLSSQQSARKGSVSETIYILLMSCHGSVPCTWFCCSASLLCVECFLCVCCFRQSPMADITPRNVVFVCLVWCVMCVCVCVCVCGVVCVVCVCVCVLCVCVVVCVCVCVCECVVCVCV